MYIIALIVVILVIIYSAIQYAPIILSALVGLAGIAAFIAVGLVICWAFNVVFGVTL